ASVVCVNQNGSGVSEYHIGSNFVVGETYLVRVFNSSASLSVAGFIICVQAYPTPSNDLCADAVLLTPSSSCVTTSGSMSGALILGAAPVCGPNASQDVWYQFTATAPTMSVSVGPNTGLNVGFEVINGSCGGASVVCVNQNGSGVSEYHIGSNFVVGETYLVRVFNSSASLSVAGFIICVQAYPTPSNDLCADAVPITPSNTCIGTNVSFSGSMMNGVAPSCAVNSAQDVWYSFVAPTSTLTVALLPGNTVNHGFELYEGSCAATPIGCRNQNGVNVSEQLEFTNLTVGTTYFIRVFNASPGLTTAANFSVCVFNTTLALEESEALSLVVFPNPVESVLNLSEPLMFTDYEIVNALGQKVQNGVVTGPIAVDRLPEGTYWIRLRHDFQTVTKAFIKK
ncbi:MAG TPA: T9SS type A sorting domain-containing protein, partial [Flavobacterium sp.]|nr:T9SS type A sorting domain-containing protein [Flavobacterium sp.]